ncbi:peptidase S41-like protein [Arcticibacter pallidicorallinus]|uniref:Peptidase S41-like protein n=1 Tax=Arcticibacter pallidicorallinus TaxID=1259464 RepID=A0A2T0U9B4_9SPHI|nr:S41 family peptidase [Arcticibacter pallidicorallinus]PRY54523.1 peptidase S41-like protein [Arcticibacter pallidicorallinus]
MISHKVGQASPTLLLLVLFSLFLSCKKDVQEPSPEPASSRTELTADSIFYFAKEVYLWNESLPNYNTFKPRQYAEADEESGFERELFAISRYAINPVTGKPYEYSASEENGTKYSYISNTKDANPVAVLASRRSAVDLEGNGYDLGLSVGFYGSDDNYKIYVLEVSPNSPAAKKGMSRGDLIKTVNGRSLGTNFDSEYTILDDTFFSSTVSRAVLTGAKNDGTPLNITLERSSYRSSPVNMDTVYTVGAKKIGYFVFSEFSTKSNSEAALNDVFSDFASAGVTDLIVDLRYNGGGYVSTAEHLTNLIAPSSVGTGTMFTERFNTLMQNGKAEILKKLPLLDDNDKIQYSNGKMLTYADADYSLNGNTYKFAKKGPLRNLSNVVFITTDGTASASELVINNLKPHMNVKTVGEKSYGKPVGFFPLRIDKYDVYMSMFESRNSEGKGEYYEGIDPNAEAFDDPRYAFGDLREECLSVAYSYLTQGSFSARSNTIAASSASRGAKLRALQSSRKTLSRSFKGMIEDRIR